MDATDTLIPSIYQEDEIKAIDDQTLNNGEHTTQSLRAEYRRLKKLGDKLHDQRDIYLDTRDVKDLDLPQTDYDDVMNSMDIEVFERHPTEVTNILVEGLRYAKRTINTKADEVVRKIIEKSLYEKNWYGGKFFINFMSRKFVPNNWLRILWDYREQLRQDFIILVILDTFLNLMNPEDDKYRKKDQEPKGHIEREKLRINDAIEKGNVQQAERCKQRLELMKRIYDFFNE